MRRVLYIITAIIYAIITYLSFADQTIFPIPYMIIPIICLISFIGVIPLVFKSETNKKSKVASIILFITGIIMLFLLLLRGPLSNIGFFEEGGGGPMQIGFIISIFMAFLFPFIFVIINAVAIVLLIVAFFSKTVSNQQVG